MSLCLVVFKKNAPLIPKNDVTEPKARNLGYSNNQLKKTVNSLKDNFKVVSKSLKLTFNLLTV